MNDILLLKLGEIVLKGLNRKGFEQKLMGNIRRRLIGLGKFKVRKPKHRLMIEFSSNSLCKRPNETFFFRFLAKGK